MTHKRHPYNSEVLTAIEARKAGVQLSDTPELSFGTFVNKKEKRVFIKPAEWAIDNRTTIIVDVHHTTYKRKH